MSSVLSEISSRGDLRVVEFMTSAGNRARIEYWSGQPWQLGTAAYWEEVARSTKLRSANLRQGRTLHEEVAACILGGFGTPATVATAAFRVLRETHQLEASRLRTASEFEKILSQPLSLGDRRVRYRFPRQRAIRLVGALGFLESDDPSSMGDLALRNWLMDAPGIGPKTASWIVRNWRASDEVAIIDVHIRRAGEVAGLFPKQWSLPRDYNLYEQAFLAWSEHSAIAPSLLDTAIWSALAGSNPLGRDILGLKARSLANVVTRRG